MIGKTVRERTSRLGLNLGEYRTERELRVAIRRVEKEQGRPERNNLAPCCELVVEDKEGFDWCPLHRRG